MMLKHVLVPVDGSEISERALRYALEIVDPAVGRITLLTAVDIPEYAVTPFYPIPAMYEVTPLETADHMMPQANDYLKNLAERIHEAGLKVAIESNIGDAASTIVSRAAELNVDAIVMSTHGRSGITRWLLGSVANKVLGSATCPVFIVPARIQAK